MATAGEAAEEVSLDPPRELEALDVTALEVTAMGVVAAAAEEVTAAVVVTFATLAVPPILKISKFSNER